MREYQPIGLLMASGNYAYAATASAASADVATASTDHHPALPIESPVSVSSHQYSMLTRASSIQSSGSPTQQQTQCDWPEFQESYNSIMDNTNLLDSCAAALSDIGNESGPFTAVRTEKLRHDFNRSLSSSTTTSTFSGSDSTAITTKCVDQYVQWLCEMECRVAAQPTLSKIIAMEPDQKAMQLHVHSNIFKEIATRSFIVKNPKRSDYKSIEERYHLLYLKVYEVLLLLDGLPTKGLSPVKRTLNESFHNSECDSESVKNMHKMHQSISSLSSLSDLIDSNIETDAIFGTAHSNVTTPQAYNQTNILSTSIGTYYFNYDDSITEQRATDKKCNEQLSSTAFLECTDKEFTFEHDLHSLLNTTDSFGQKSQEHNTSMMSNEQHFVELDIVDGSREHSLSAAHNKVYKWLNTNPCADIWKSKSSMHLNCSTASEADYRMIYRAKSDFDLSAHRQLDPKNMQSSLHTSCLLPSIVISPSKHCELELNESVAEEHSLIWDNFQMGNDSLKVDSDVGITIGNESDTKELSNQLCYFGDDYSLHLNELAVMDSELESSSGLQHKIPNENAANDGTALSTALPTSESLKKESTASKRGRRSRRKRSKNAPTDDSLENSTKSLDQSSKSSLSAATTASADDRPANCCESMQTNQSTVDGLKPETTISYNSNEKQFEVHTKDMPDAPKKMKINEMRPEDFYDIVKMCQSNIDCVITVLGADPNRTLTLAYCQQMKFERYQKSTDAETTTTTTCACKQEQQGKNDATDLMAVVNSPRPSPTTHTAAAAAMECKCGNSVESQALDLRPMCVCAWVSHTIAMILNFLMDCWNIFRNMKLYTYLCRVVKALFGSTRYVADHLRSKHGLANAKAIKYS